MKDLENKKIGNNIRKIIFLHLINDNHAKLNITNKSIQ